MSLKEEIEKRRRDQLTRTQREEERLAREAKAKPKPKAKVGVGKPSFDTEAAIAKIERQIEAATGNPARQAILRARKKALRENVE